MGAVNRNKGAIGGGIIGSAFGPVGTAAGAYAGSQFDTRGGTASTKIGLGATQAKQIGIGGGGMPDTPPPAPDLTDQMVRAAQRAEAMKLRTGRTRASTFKTGGAY